jgi:hypothetical protein
MVLGRWLNWVRRKSLKGQTHSAHDKVEIQSNKHSCSLLNSSLDRVVQQFGCPVAQEAFCEITPEAGIQSQLPQLYTHTHLYQTCSAGPKQHNNEIPKSDLQSHMCQTCP